MKVILLLFLATVVLAAQPTIAPPVFSGSGLNDATIGGAATGIDRNTTFIVTIATTGAPDRVSATKLDDTGSSSLFNGTAITAGSAIPLSGGVTIAFAASTGHTRNAAWTIQVQVGSVPAASDKSGDLVSVADFGSCGAGCDDTKALTSAIASQTSKRSFELWSPIWSHGYLMNLGLMADSKNGVVGYQGNPGANITLTSSGLQDYNLFNWYYGPSAVYGLSVPVPGEPAPGATVFTKVLTEPLTFHGDFSGSSGNVNVNPASEAAFAVYDTPPSGSRVKVGSVCISAAGVFAFSTSATSCTPGGSAYSASSGDTITVVAPNPADPKLSGISFSLAATSTGSSPSTAIRTDRAARPGAMGQLLFQESGNSPTEDLMEGDLCLYGGSHQIAGGNATWNQSFCVHPSRNEVVVNLNKLSVAGTVAAASSVQALKGGRYLSWNRDGTAYSSLWNPLGPGRGNQAWEFDTNVPRALYIAPNGWIGCNPPLVPPVTGYPVVSYTLDCKGGAAPIWNLEASSGNNTIYLSSPGNGTDQKYSSLRMLTNGSVELASLHDDHSTTQVNWHAFRNGAMGFNGVTTAVPGMGTDTNGAMRAQIPNFGASCTPGAAGTDAAIAAVLSSSGAATQLGICVCNSNGTCGWQALLPPVTAPSLSAYPTVPTSAALAAAPAQCNTGQYSTGIAANGNANCSQVAYSQLSGAPPLTTRNYVQPRDPGCTNIGDWWYNTTTTTTVSQVCLSVAGALIWVVK